jgi:anti-sigma B factor antagonist
MGISVEIVNGVAVVVVAVDELDAGNTAEFKQRMAPVLSAHSKVVIDLSQVRFIDSSGLGAMLSCLRQLTAKGGELKLCALTKQVRAAFELVRLHRILDIHESRSAAVDAFK